MKRLIFSLVAVTIMVAAFFNSYAFAENTESADITRTYTITAGEAEKFDETIIINDKTYKLKETKLVSTEEEDINLTADSEEELKSATANITNVIFTKTLKEARTASKEFYNYYLNDIPNSIRIDGANYKKTKTANLNREEPFTIDIIFNGEEDCLYFNYGNLFLDLEHNSLTSYSQQVLDRLTVPKEFYKIEALQWSSDFNNDTKSRTATLTGTQSANWVAKYEEDLDEDDPRSYTYEAHGKKLLSKTYEASYELVPIPVKDEPEEKNTSVPAIVVGSITLIVIAIAFIAFIARRRNNGKENK